MHSNVVNLVSGVLRPLSLATIGAFAVGCPVHVRMQEWMSRLVLWLLTLSPGHAETMLPCTERTIQGANGQRYEFIIWCTPIIPWLASLIILSRLWSLRSFFLAAPASLILVTAAKTTDAVLSIHLAETGVPWMMAHYPSHICMYVLIVCGSVYYVAKSNGQCLPAPTAVNRR